MDKIEVKLPDKSYPIIYNKNILNPLKQFLLQKKRKVAIISDKNIFSIYGQQFVKEMQPYSKLLIQHIFGSGEITKNLNSIESVLDKLLENNWNRDDLIIALGGGIVGDMAAFAASIIVRGVDFVAIPTTLLSQVDSSVGGKTGVNHRTGKNLIGTFYQPRAVFISSDFFSTLDLREIKTGLAEVIKYGVIWDADFFGYLKEFFSSHSVNSYKGFSDEFWKHIIMTSVAIKAKVVEQDEKESGLRMILNYGHTFGHAIEKLTNYKIYNHGEAVAIGMNMAAYVAYKIGLITETVLNKQKDLLEICGLPVIPDINNSAREFVDVMKIDKKVRDNKLTLILPEKIGKVRIEKGIKEQEIKTILKEIIK